MGEELGRAIFVDRDGVINRNRADYCKCWDEFEFLEGAREALARLAETDSLIVVVSNQSAIGRGLTSREAVEEINGKMREEVEAAGSRIDAILYCPHRPDEGCDCRKPKAGMLREAGRRYGLDLQASYFVGDSVEDMEAGRAAGCKAILVRTGRGREAEAKLAKNGGCSAVVDDLCGAVEWILERERQGGGDD